MNSKLHTEDHITQEQPLLHSFFPSMPTLRVELLKSREEDEDQNTIVEKRVVHSNRVNLAAGYSHHGPKLKYNFSELKQGKEIVAMAKTSGVVKKLSERDEKGSTRISTYKAQTPQSPSESDSFSIESSSSSCKSESDSIKKPSPPASLVKPSLPMSLGSDLGAQAVEMWDVTQMSPGDLSKAIHEKLYGDKALQNGFLEFNFSQGKMVNGRLRRKDEDNAASHANTEHHSAEYVLKPESVSVEVLNEDWAHGLATPAFYSATARSPETSSEISYHSGDTCSAPCIGQELKQTQSIKELMDDHKVLHKEAGGLHADQHKQCQMEAHNRMHEHEHISQVTNKGLENDSAPFEADINIDRVQISSNASQCEKRSRYSKALSCHFAAQSRQEEGFSFQAPLKSTYMQDTTPCKRTSVDRSTYPEVVSDQSKPASAKVSVEKYIFSTPLMGRSASSTQSHNERGKITGSLPSLGMNTLTRAEAGALTPPPVHEIKCKASIDEHTPVSPLSLSEARNYARYDECNGREYIDMAWFATSKTQPPVHSLSKAHWDWRSKSLGARASLKSAVRNLEAAFGGSRSVSLPKARSQTHQRDKKADNSKFIDRVFVSPVKGRHKRTEVLKPIQRPPYSGDPIIQDPLRMRRDIYPDDSVRECVGANHPVFRPLPVSKHHKKSEIPEYKVSSLPTSRSVHCLAPLKGLSGHTSPVPPGSALRQPNPTTSCMLQGYLQCIVRDGLVCYTLSLKDSDEMFLAKACAFGQEGCKWMYTFHSGRSKGRGKGAHGWRSWLKKDGKSTADLAGKMQVSSNLCAEVSPTGKRTQSLVSEFILYEERNDDAIRSQSLRFLSSNSSTFTPAESPLPARSAYEFVHPSVSARKQVPDIPKSPSSARMSLKSASTHQPQPCSSPLKGKASHQSSRSIDVWSDSDVTEPEVRRLRSNSPSLHSELAAIVIKMPAEGQEIDSHLSNTCPRRSLRFSDDQSKGSLGDIQERYGQGRKVVTMTLPGTKLGRPDDVVCMQTSECVTMMLPKEHHGLPKGGVQGPTSLIERWKCGGKCDCGGWDLGCGMKIFSTQRCEKLSTTANYGNSIQSISHNQPLNIYSQGKTREVLLNLSLVQEGYFILKFKNELSPLKAFAASVAILHSRESSSSTGRWAHVAANTIQSCQSDSEILEGGDMPAFLEVCKDIPTWCPPNHPLSPFGRV